MTRVAYGARLHVRRAGSPACPDHRVHLDAETTVMVPVGPDSRIVREAAHQEAEDTFRREMGLGVVMDLPGARVDIEVWLWLPVIPRVIIRLGVPPADRRRTGRRQRSGSGCLDDRFP